MTTLCGITNSLLQSKLPGPIIKPIPEVVNSILCQKLQLAKRGYTSDCFVVPTNI